MNKCRNVLFDSCSAYALTKHTQSDDAHSKGEHSRVSKAWRTRQLFGGRIDSFCANLSTKTLRRAHVCILPEGRMPKRIQTCLPHVKSSFSHTGNRIGNC